MPRHTPKGVKKFKAKHLSDTIERRKEFAKVKQRNQQKEQRKARRAVNDTHGSSKDDSTNAVAFDETSGPDIKQMSMDEFFQGGFEALNDIAPSHKPTATNSKLGKRKRQNAADILEDGSSSGGDQAFAEDSDGSDLQEQPSTYADGVDSHKNDLDALAEKDPDFYKYLKEHDSELLDFAAGGDTLELSDSDDDTPVGKSGERAADKDDEESDGIIVTPSIVSKWATSMAEKNSQMAMKEVVLAFRAAAHANEEDGKAFKYTIPDPETYHQVLTTALEGVPAVLAHHLPVKEMQNGRIRVPTDSKKYRNLMPLLKSHAISITHLFANLSDAAALNMVLSSLLSLIPYFLSFKKALKDLVKSVIGIWSDISSPDTTRINAFLIIRRLAIIGDASLREAVQKTTYQGFVKGARNTTIHTLAAINLIKNSAVELWGLDPGLGYTTGFTYIRQLAIHLRTSIAQPSKDGYKAVYNWQYVHSLDFWSRVLSTHCSPDAVPTLKQPTDSPLHPLIYPLVQVTLGALRLVPSPAYFPLRFQLTRSLLRISRSTNTYIPLAPSLLEVLQSPELKKPAKNSTLKALDFDTSIRAPESYLHTKVYQDGLAEQLSELLSEFFGVWAKNIAFPELVIPPTVFVKRWLREVSRYATKGKHGVSEKKNGTFQGNKNAKANAQFSLLVQKLQAHSSFVENKRRKIEFSINDKKGVEEFSNDISWDDTPLGSYIGTMRRQKEARRKLLEESRKEDERRRKQQSGAEDEDTRGLSGEELDDEDENEDEVEDESEENLEDEMTNDEESD